LIVGVWDSGRRFIRRKALIRGGAFYVDDDPGRSLPSLGKKYCLRSLIK
jgi:hypothetical protein